MTALINVLSSIDLSKLAPAGGIGLLIGWVIMMWTKGREEHTKRHGIDTDSETKRIELANALTVKVLEQAQAQVKDMSSEMTILRKELADQRADHEKAIRDSEERMSKHVQEIEKTLTQVQFNLTAAIGHIRALMRLPHLDDATRKRVTDDAETFLKSVS